MSKGATIISGTSITEAHMANMLKLSSSAMSEGVDGTSPTPGQDDPQYVPPSTSTVTNPGALGGEDPTEEPADGSDIATGEEHPNESRVAMDALNLFREADDEDDDDKDGDSEDDDKEDSEDDEEDKPEQVEMHCKECGYEERYSMNEEDLASNPPPMRDGEIDPTCPMCGADCDMSLMGATDQEAVTDPEPFTSPQGESYVPEHVVAVAGSYMHRAVEGESIDALAQEIIESDFLDHRTYQEAVSSRLGTEARTANPTFETVVSEWYNGLSETERAEVLQEANAYSRAYDQTRDYNKSDMLGKYRGRFNGYHGKGGWDAKTPGYDKLQPVQQRAVKKHVRDMAADPSKRYNVKAHNGPTYAKYDRLHKALGSVGFEPTTSDVRNRLQLMGPGSVHPDVNKGHNLMKTFKKHADKHLISDYDMYGRSSKIGDHEFSYTQYHPHKEFGTVGIHEPKSRKYERGVNMVDAAAQPHIYHKPAGATRGRNLPITHPDAQALIQRMSEHS